jgi:hypothetical protein
MSGFKFNDDGWSGLGTVKKDIAGMLKSDLG